MSKPTLIVDDAEFELFKRAYIAVTIAPYKDENLYRAQVVTANIEHMFETCMHNTNLFPLWCEAKRQAFEAAALAHDQREPIGYRYRAHGGPWEWMDASPFADGRTHHNSNGEQLEPVYARQPAL